MKRLLRDADIGQFCISEISDESNESIVCHFPQVSLQCRATIEANITAVARGQRSKESVLDEAVQFFKADFNSASQKQSMYLPTALHALC